MVRPIIARILRLENGQVNKSRGVATIPLFTTITSTNGWSSVALLIGGGGPGHGAQRPGMADQSAPQGQKRFMNVRPLFVAHAQPPELIQPSEGPFDHPSPSPQLAVVFRFARNGTMRL